MNRLGSLALGIILVAALLVWFGVYQLNEHLWDWLLYGLVGMDPASRTTETLHFFLYDTVKITLLLCGIIFIVTVLRSYMSVERTRALLGGKRICVAIYYHTPRTERSSAVIRYSYFSVKTELTEQVAA